MDEFGLIKEYFAPLAKPFAGALQLKDDAALLDPPAGCQLVITTDAISEGVHFLGSEDPALIAQKLLRVNLSDLAAMGATPMIYFLDAMLPKDTASDWVKRFAQGLQEDQALFDIHLGGGDTTSTHGPFSFALTAIGNVPKGAALKRSGARVGDMIYVSGTLGDAALGLKLLQRKIHAHGDTKLFLEQRYFLPSPRLALGRQLREMASAAMDISDGLVQDLGHICSASKCGATLHRDQLPLSGAAAQLIAHDATLWECVLGGGDDYELLFTAPAEKEMLVQDLAKELDLPLTAIGEITEGRGVEVVGEGGKPLALTHTGFKHF